MTTILDVLEKGTSFLDKKGIAEPRLNMELMVACELGIKRMDLYLRFDQPLDKTALASLREKLKKRSENVPLQHINKVVHFGNYEFYCDHRALIPRPETEELVDLVKKQLLTKPARILDVGCGSGVIGLTLSKDLGSDCEQLTLADLSTEALSLCEQNRKALEVKATLIESNLFSSITGTFDLIVANLPYIANGERAKLEPEVLHDPRMALFSGSDGLDLLRLFCAECTTYLNTGGLVALEVGYDQGEIVAGFLREAGLSKVMIGNDLNGIPRFPLAQQA
ncbi:MAG: peptide chain release factor N(5)-glutamine methyltransferase [Akkermansiaceae bacterium]|jgi:release factor glutamine methyltransferase|nr:peptide chain release factor N(5)-glutamine methyltransferase [Akkermansiaceae bacterium]|tara:strand:- start:1490 stop:2329 length:840 start_codon:yes stop_codon:yes gene_type:complete